MDKKRKAQEKNDAGGSNFSTSDKQKLNNLSRNVQQLSVTVDQVVEEKMDTSDDNAPLFTASDEQFRTDSDTNRNNAALARQPNARAKKKYKTERW